MTMRLFIYLLCLVFNLAFAQNIKWSEKEIETYADSVDALKNKNQLITTSCMRMMVCSGSNDGYYLNDELVLLDGTYNAELGYSSRKFYFYKGQVVKIVYREHYAEWGRYAERYPPDSIEWDPSKMTYTDTLYKINLGTTTNFYKSAGQKIISTKINQELINRLLNCSVDMREAQSELIKQVDSLKYVKDMHFNCMPIQLIGDAPEICGDPLYWQVVRIQKGIIEVLIDRMDDTTDTEAWVPYFGYHYRVADIAYTSLQEIIHGIPTFELLGVPFDENGCGYCSFWQHLNASMENRLAFQKAVKYWYETNRDNLVWVESNVYYSCDCSAKHPVGGHYELRKK